MKKQSQNQHLGTLAPLLLFVSFTAAVLLVLLQGADIYQTIADRNDGYSKRRTAAQYITTRIHQNDSSSSIMVSDFQISDTDLFSTDSGFFSGDTLYLLEKINGRALCTRIYCYDGYLRELFSETESQMKPSSGQKILPMESICFNLDRHLLEIQIKYPDGTSDSMVLSLRSTKEAAYEQ